jgi:hypothetical protein
VKVRHFVDWDPLDVMRGLFSDPATAELVYASQYWVPGFKVAVIGMYWALSLGFSVPSAVCATRLAGLPELVVNIARRYLFLGHGAMFHTSMPMYAVLPPSTVVKREACSSFWLLLSVE